MLKLIDPTFGSDSLDEIMKLCVSADGLKIWAVIYFKICLIMLRLHSGHEQSCFWRIVVQWEIWKFNNLIVEFSKSKLAKSFKFCFGIPVDSIHIIAGKIGENLEKMSDEPQTLVTLQSCEDHHNMCKGHISKVWAEASVILIIEKLSIKLFYMCKYVILFLSESGNNGIFLKFVWVEFS